MARRLLQDRQLVSIAANRISYIFDFHGPSVAVDTACTSSIVCVHQACVRLLAGECSTALAGGVSLLTSIRPWLGFARASMLSPAGRCKSFDARSDGYVRSEGGGLVLLKPLAEAERDGDRILGVILASGVKSDGRTVGLSMPNGDAQEALLRNVYAQCGIQAEDGFYVEAHGTGTAVGDPIECGALGRVLGVPREDMAVDDFGADFTLIALAQASVDPNRVCRYLEEALSSLMVLLEQTPNSPIQLLQVLPSDERAQVLEISKGTEHSFGTGTLDGLFSAQAACTPGAVAVVDVAGGELTYAELDARSTLLARRLVSRGVGPGQVARVRMERSAATILSLLAILKAGGVYLPLDPAYPPDRLAYMAADAGAVLVIESRADLESTPESALPTAPGSERLAYVIYTSGTTGLPKGVAVSHTAAVNLAFARRAAHDPLGVGDRVLAAISVGFDVSMASCCCRCFRVRL